MDLVVVWVDYVGDCWKVPAEIRVYRFLRSGKTFPGGYGFWNCDTSDIG